VVVLHGRQCGRSGYTHSAQFFLDGMIAQQNATKGKSLILVRRGGHPAPSPANLLSAARGSPNAALENTVLAKTAAVCLGCDGTRHFLIGCCRKCRERF
jgi:hypothetical protein